MTFDFMSELPESTQGAERNKEMLRLGFIAREGLMKGILIGLAATQLIVAAASPADAITAELAKKCRDAAIKSHPPPIPPGNKAYAQAERDYFRECVSRNGQMPDNGAQQDQSKPAQH